MPRATTRTKKHRSAGRMRLRGKDRSNQVRIRMYRQGIGDCFLVTFPAPDRPRHLLIDCGVHTSTPKGPDWIRRIVANLKLTTQRHIDALVVTHEHWDHVSAFARPELFQDVEIDELWFAWTENPDDALAEKLGRDRAMRLAALTAAAKQLTGARQTSLKAVGHAVGEVLTFFDPPDPARSFSPRTRQAFDALKALSDRKRYLMPGDLVEETNLFPGARFFVLGPPRDETLIKDEAGTIGVDTYELSGRGRSFFAGVWAAAGAVGFETGIRNPDDFVPFPLELQWDAAVYARDFPALAREHDATRNAWRRIDDDWLVSSAQLALQLDSDTNNTSLVLAIELSGGKVLLFPGDAQIGNWKSWTKLDWTVPDRQGKTTVVRTRDLLGRTVFYKTGHHGSHNATRRPEGLQSMTSQDLVAAIPVNREVASKLRGWDMPAPRLEAQLQRSTRGRVLRADRTWPGPNEPVPPHGQTESWQAFLDNVEFGKDQSGDLYIDYFV